MIGRDVAECVRGDCSNRCSVDEDAGYLVARVRGDRIGLGGS